MSKTTPEAMSFLKEQHTSGSSAWGGLCLKLQRTARGLPAVYPSALSAMNATPAEYRVRDLSKVKRGMVAYFDDPNDGNPYGHITAAAGRNDDGELLHWTNDAAGHGKVSLVRHSFFERYWGDRFQFAAGWLNGAELDLPEKKAKELPLEDHGQLIREAIGKISQAIAFHKARNNVKLVKALERDREVLRETLKKFGG